MFSVYGSSGRLFRGTLQEMRQVRSVHSVDRLRATEPVARDGRDSLLREAIESEPAPAGELHRAAIAAYQQTGQPVRLRWSEAAVSTAMRHDVVTLADSATVGEAWALLDQHGIGQAPVVNASHVLVGLVTRAGVMTFARLPRPHGDKQAWDVLLASSVAAVMHTPVSSVHPETDLRHAATALLEGRLPGLPVVDGHGLVIGFVTGSDILGAALHDAALDLWG